MPPTTAKARLPVSNTAESTPDRKGANREIGVPREAKAAETPTVQENDVRSSEERSLSRVAPFGMTILIGSSEDFDG